MINPEYSSALLSSYSHSNINEKKINLHNS
ncbi:hypothetical protein DN37_2837 [Vibrio cholerae]|nr:hypothetical protein DN37_2837 [Vibrio cholerae]